MDAFELTLVPDYGSNIQMVLSSSPFVPSDVDEMVLNREYIYSDRPYHAELTQSIISKTFAISSFALHSPKDIN